MVRIVNGEILPDDDPRAIASARESSAAPNVGPHSRTQTQTLPPPSMPAAGQPVGLPPPKNPLDAFARFIGIEHRHVSIPAFSPLGLPETEIPAINCVVAAAILLTFPTWRTVLAVALLYYFTARTHVRPPSGATVGGAALPRSR